MRTQAFSISEPHSVLFLFYFFLFLPRLSPREAQRWYSRLHDFSIAISPFCFYLTYFSTFAMLILTPTSGSLTHTGTRSTRSMVFLGRKKTNLNGSGFFRFALCLPVPVRSCLMPTSYASVPCRDGQHKTITSLLNPDLGITEVGGTSMIVTDRLASPLWI